ncbi:MAG: hypothetical protein M3Y64_04015, partial [Gemmatimonadota bacterium]|nr:hypothetical protein [Gemmatimonadota bacterium]
MSTDPEAFTIDRRRFLQRLGLIAAGVAATPSLLTAAGGSAESAIAPRFRSSEFVFARLRYNSGDWDYNPKVCANVLDSV